MTTDQSAAVQVTPPANSRLEQLHAVWAEKKSAAEAAAKELKDVADAIKAELTAAAPGQTRVDLVSQYGPTLALTYSESWRVDATRLKAENPTVYVQFAKKSGSWSLRLAQGPTQGGGR